MSEPLFVKPKMHEKIWGGTKLRDEFNYAIPSDTTGECWAISAHPNGSSVLKNGRYEGWELGELYAQHTELFGCSHGDSVVFPLLTKILDANEWLSVQVHPDDDYALVHTEEMGKTECWYVISAEEGSEIVYGHNAKSVQELKKMILEGCWDDLLRKVPVQAGDFFYVPSGTMHAIGGGILIFEIQQSSDLTYRVYDFDRKTKNGALRDLHLQESFDVLNIGPVKNSRPVICQLGDMRVTNFVVSDFFVVYKWELTGQINCTRTVPYLLVSVLAGKGHIVVAKRGYALQKGDHFILPSDVETWCLEGQGLEMIVSHP